MTPLFLAPIDTLCACIVCVSAESIGSEASSQLLLFWPVPAQTPQGNIKSLLGSKEAVSRKASQFPPFSQETNKTGKKSCVVELLRELRGQRFRSSLLRQQ